MRILCEAVSFGFGPVSKLLSLCELLNKRHQLDFIGSGCSLALAMHSNIFNKYIQCETTTFVEARKMSFSDYDAVISIMNPSFAKFVLEQRCKLIIVDSLFYMWDAIDYTWNQCDLLLIQAFWGEQERLQNSKHSNNAHIVGPIVSTKMTKPNIKYKNLLLINFGGADYPHFKNFDNVSLFIRMLVDHISILNKFERKIVSIGPRCINVLKHLESTNLKVRTFSHDEFLELLSGASMLLTVPGLTTTFESFHLGVPTFFLPPLNYSQLLNLRRFRALGLSNMGFCWDDYLPELMPEILPEKDGVQMIEELISKAIKDKKLFFIIVDQYKKMLSIENIDNIALEQDKFYQSIGGRGTYDAVQLIEGILQDGFCMENCKIEQISNL